MLELVSPWSS